MPTSKNLGSCLSVKIEKFKIDDKFFQEYECWFLVQNYEQIRILAGIRTFLVKIALWVF
jgi:hypothetical protein